MVVARLLSHFTFRFRINSPMGQPLGRWHTNVDKSIIERRIDLANIDSCGDEICAKPYELVKMDYYRPTEKKYNNDI